MISLNLKLDKESLDFLKNFPDRFKKSLLSGVRKAMYYAESKAKKSFGQAGNLKVRTGYLRNTITSNVQQVSDGVEGTLSSNAVYAAIHEYGGTIKPVNKMFLKFETTQMIFARQVTMPARPFLGPAIEEGMDKMEDIIEKEITEEALK
jgi:phage gpG-like protein